MNEYISYYRCHCLGYIQSLKVYWHFQRKLSSVSKYSVYEKNDVYIIYISICIYMSICICINLIDYIRNSRWWMKIINSHYNNSLELICFIRKTEVLWISSVYFSSSKQKFPRNVIPHFPEKCYLESPMETYQKKKG